MPTDSRPLTDWEVRRLVNVWFRKITDHAPEPELLEMIGSGEIEIRFPERTLRSVDDFKDWYRTVSHAFFDQVHEIEALSVDLDGAEARVNLIVNWQARTWEPPAGYSVWLGYHIEQDWVVKRDPGSGRPIIARYIVGDVVPQLMHQANA